jgi:hypothetical protein
MKENRKVYVAKCSCGEQDIREGKAPREKLCSCGQWVKFEIKEHDDKI